LPPAQTAAIATLISSKVNQWTLLMGSLPIAYMAGGGGSALVLDGRLILCGVYAALAVAGLAVNRRHLVPTLRAPFQRQESSEDASADPAELVSLRA
jgi:cation:H+ antiporter